MTPTFNFNGKNLDVFGSVVFAENMTINMPIWKYMELIQGSFITNGS